jgi:hypothetical protein
MFASGAAYNKAFRACIDRNGPIRRGLRRRRNSLLAQKLARRSGRAEKAIPARANAGHLTGERMAVTVKSTHLPPYASNCRGPVEMISMPDPIQTDADKPAPSIVPAELPGLSDDECLARLARAVAVHDSEHLDEVALLIGRLAVTIE